MIVAVIRVLLARFLDKLLKVKSSSNNFVPGLSTLDLLKDCKFSRAESNVDQIAKLKLKIQTVSKAKIIDVLVVNTEEVLGLERGITTSKATDEARILCLNFALDTDILDKVNVVLPSATAIEVKVARRKQCMADFVADEQIIDILGLVFPHRKAKYAVLNVKESGGIVTVLDRDVLLSKESRQCALSSGIHYAEILHSTAQK